MKIRPATRDDVSTVLALIRELAEYEREPNAVVATEADLLRDGFDGASPQFHVLLLETAPTTKTTTTSTTTSGEGAASNEAPMVTVGFALYFFTYSTWRGRSCLFLEDLFVRPECRGRGYGAALMRALAREAVARDCPRFMWQVLDWNKPSIAFYERLGAEIQREWLSVRLEGEALSAFARG